MPDDCDREDITHSLLNHKHPNGKVLKEHKGIIYTSNIDEANALADSINNAKSTEGSKLFEPGYVHVIHSGDKEGVDTDLKKDDAGVEQFKKRKTGVAIAVKMLNEGYDDDNVDYVIANKNFYNADDLHQAIGRALRLNHDDPEKVGYALISTGNKEKASQEVTCYPADAEELKKTHKNLVGNVGNTIKAFRDAKKSARDISNGIPILTDQDQTPLRQQSVLGLTPLGRKNMGLYP